jgi:hypothetical protein
MERKKTGEVRDGSRNCKNLIFITKIKLENNFLYLPPWQSRVKFYKSKILPRWGLKVTKISSKYLNQIKSYDKKKKIYTVKK